MITFINTLHYEIKFHTCRRRKFLILLFLNAIEFVGHFKDFAYQQFLSKLTKTAAHTSIDFLYHILNANPTPFLLL